MDSRERNVLSHPPSPFTASASCLLSILAAGAPVFGCTVSATRAVRDMHGGQVAESENFQKWKRQSNDAATYLARMPDKSAYWEIMPSDEALLHTSQANHSTKPAQKPECKFKHSF